MYFKVTKKSFLNLHEITDEFNRQNSLHFSFFSLVLAHSV